MEYENTRERIGTELQAIRLEKGLTQRALSDLSGINQANIASIERGRYNAKIDTIQKLCDAMDSILSISKK